MGKIVFGKDFFEAYDKVVYIFQYSLFKMTRQTLPL